MRVCGAKVDAAYPVVIGSTPPKMIIKIEETFILRIIRRGCGSRLQKVSIINVGPAQKQVPSRKLEMS